MLFNVREHEVDGYLKIVEKHASGLLPEMRKDGKVLFPTYLYMNLVSIGVIIIIVLGGGDKKHKHTDFIYPKGSKKRGGDNPSSLPKRGSI